MMHIILSTDRYKFTKAIGNITSWDMQVMSCDHRDDPAYSDYWGVEYDFVLGCSEDKSSWGLAALPWGRDESFDGNAETLRSACTAILVDPPSVREDSILMILFRVFNEVRRTGRISVQQTDEILASVPFREYLPARSYLPELPESWLSLPVELCVGFSLSEGACLYASIFKEYSRASLKDALEMLCSPRIDGIMIQYDLVVRDVIPFLAWDVDWPLSRRGKEAPCKREKVQGVLPWEYHADQTVLSVYQWLPIRNIWAGIPYYGEPVVRLKVGGRSQQEAISNWHRCAKALRKLRPQARPGTVYEVVQYVDTL